MKQKTVVTLCMLAMAGTLLTGCSKKLKVEVVDETTPTAEVTVAPTEQATEEPEVTEEPVTEEENVLGETEENATSNTDTDVSGEISDNWEDCQFEFDGHVYQLPAAYSEFEENGWTVDWAEYGYKDGYVMNPGDMVSGSVELTNPKYSDDFRLVVGLQNNDRKAKDISECDIWSIELDTCKGFEQVDKYPSMTIAKGITFGSSENEVIKAFGKTEDIYTSKEFGYSTYSYDSEFTYYMTIDVYKDKGVTRISIEKME